MNCCDSTPLERDPSIDAWMNEHGGGGAIAHGQFESKMQGRGREILHDGCPVAVWAMRQCDTDRAEEVPAATIPAGDGKP